MVSRGMRGEVAYPLGFRFDMVRGMNIKIMKLHPSAQVPSYAQKHDAGMDMCTVERVSIPAGRMALIATGLAMEIPRGCVGLIWDKSGLASKHGLKVMGGVIDAGYRGEIKVALMNLGRKKVALEVGHKIAQMLIQRVHQAHIKEVKKLSSTIRGSGGFGSTGK